MMLVPIDGAQVWRQSCSLVPVTAWLLVAMQCHCAAQNLTFIDASEFTNLAPSSAFNPGGSSTPVDGIGDNLWGFRATYGAVGEIYEASGGTSATATGGMENVPQITQTISGLPAGSYDIYVAYWTAVEADWNIRAGLQGGIMNHFNRNGPQTDENAPDFAAMQNAIAGIPAGSCIWAEPPLDLNFEPVFIEGDRIMLLGKVGTAAPIGGEIAVQLDDLSTSDYPALPTSTYRTWFDGVAYAATGTVISPELAIDRNTGTVTIRNDTGIDLELVSYRIISPAGSFDTALWNPITGRLDNGGGFDNDSWQINSQTATELAEQEATINDGGILGATPLELGKVWIRSPYEDVQIELTVADSRVYVLTPSYSGTGMILGDFNASGGDLDAQDFGIMMSNMHTLIGATTQAASHSLGDITGDGTVDFNDYRAFRNVFEAANGAGSFAAMLARVPEPSAIMLSLILCSAAMLATGRKRHLGMHTALMFAFVLVVLIPTPPAVAQVTYLDATLANTDIATGGPDTLWADGDDGSTGGTVTDGSALNDGLWRYRSAYYNGIWEATGSSAQAEDCVEIVTTATGLGIGFYKAYVFWHPVLTPDPSSGGTEEYPIRAGFESNPNANQIFTQLNTEFVQGVVGRDALDSPDALTFANPQEVPPDATTRPLLYGEIGITEVTTGSLPIYIDDLPANPGPEGYGGTLSDLRPWYQGIGYVEAIELSLEINTTTGRTKLINNQSINFDMSYYEMRSSSGSLNPTGWSSIAEVEDGVPSPIPDGLGWDEAGGSNANILCEGRLTGMETFQPLDEISLGMAFVPGESQDIRFYYAAPGGSLTEGIVQYVSGGEALADFDDDGDIDGTDFMIWQAGFGKFDPDTNPATRANGDADLDGAVDRDDYFVWETQFGTIAGYCSAAIPEPAGLLLAWVCLIGWFVWQPE